MIAVVLWTLGGIVAWLAIGIPVALIVGRVLREGDRRPESDWLADQPAEVLAPAEITRRIASYEQDMAA